MAKLPDHVGIDFGTHSVKAVELRNISSNPELVNLGSQITPNGVINSDTREDKKKLADVLKKLRSEEHTSEIKSPNTRSDAVF